MPNSWSTYRLVSYLCHRHEPISEGHLIHFKMRYPVRFKQPHICKVLNTTTGSKLCFYQC